MHRPLLFCLTKLHLESKATLNGKQAAVGSTVQAHFKERYKNGTTESMEAKSCTEARTA